MTTYMLADVICHEFEKAAGKNQHGTGNAMHIGFGMRCYNGDQYNVTHMYIYAPHNYVYVAIQEERIDADGHQHLGPMEIISYHDSCWRDAIQHWIHKNQDEFNVFRSFKLFEWCDIFCLSEEERQYLNDAERWRRERWDGQTPNPCPLPNPFDKRGLWSNKPSA